MENDDDSHGISNKVTIEAGNLRILSMDVLDHPDFPRTIRNINFAGAVIREPYRRPQVTLINPVGEWNWYKFRQIEDDGTATVKFVVDPEKDIKTCLEGIPAISRMSPHKILKNPVWLEKISFGSSFGHNFSFDISIEMEAEPGLLIFSGSNHTGKSYIVNSILENKCPLQWSSEKLKPLSPTSTIQASNMPRFRKLIGYGQLDGTLLMPIEFEGNATQKLDRIGDMLLRNLSIQEGWNGLVLDTPLQGLDEVKSIKLLETIVRMAEDRQVIVTSRDSNETRTWEAIASDHNVSCIVAKLNEGRDIKVSRKSVGMKM